jgi:hypothetical protein
VQDAELSSRLDAIIREAFSLVGAVVSLEAGGVAPDDADDELMTAFCTNRLPKVRAACTNKTHLFLG